MPKIPERQALIKELNSVLKVMSMWDDDDTSDAEEIFDICALLQSNRFINLRQHVRKNKSMNDDSQNTNAPVSSPQSIHLISPYQ
jgi:hypothetical protein